MAIVGYELLRDLAVIIVISAFTALAFRKLKQPLIIGYIVAGIIVGPSTPPGSLLLHPDAVSALAQVGVTMLLFMVGLEFPIEKLVGRIRRVATIAVVEVVGTFASAGLAGISLGFSFYDSLFAGLAITVTSTVVVSKVLTELGVLQDDSATLVVSVSIIEDVIVLVMLAALQSVASIESAGQPQALSLILPLGLVALFIGGTLTIGNRIVPRVINSVGRLENNEVLLLAMLGMAFVLSLLGDLIGISVATGAFLAGLLVAKSDYHQVSKVLAGPLRDMFAALFFVSMGALMDISLIPFFVIPALLLVLVSISSKILSVLLATRALKYSSSVAVKTSFGLSASGGELGLVVAKGGLDAGVASAFILPMLGVITVITTFISPYVIRIGWRSVAPTPRLEAITSEPEPEESGRVQSEPRPEEASQV